MAKNKIKAVVNYESEIVLDTSTISRDGKLKSNLKKFVLVSQKFDMNEVDVKFKVMPKLKDGKNLVINIFPKLEWILRKRTAEDDILTKRYVSESDINVDLKSNEIIVRYSFSAYHDWLRR